MHIIGFGTVYHCFVGWKWPRERLDIYDKEIWGISPFFVCRLVECLVEAVPLMAVQCFVMVQHQDYEIILLVSMSISFLSASVPAVSIIKVLKDKRPLFKLLDVIVWTSDCIVRTVPLIYFLVYRFYVGITLLVLFLGTSNIYVVCVMDMRCRFENEHGFAFGWTLIFNSVYKIYSIVYKTLHERKSTLYYSIIEQVFRALISIGTTVYLESQRIIHDWQCFAMTGLAIFTTVMQIFFFLQTVQSNINRRRDNTETVDNKEQKQYGKNISGVFEMTETEL